MNNIEFLENLIDVIKAQSSFNDVDMALLKGINRIINERWITIHPHGEDSEDYRRLKLEDGESPKEAIDRVYKKEDKKTDEKSDKKGSSQRVDYKAYREKENELYDKLSKINIDDYQGRIDEYNAEIGKIREERSKNLDKLKEAVKQEVDRLKGIDINKLSLEELNTYEKDINDLYSESLEPGDTITIWRKRREITDVKGRLQAQEKAKAIGGYTEKLQKLTGFTIFSDISSYPEELQKHIYENYKEVYDKYPQIKYGGLQIENLKETTYANNASYSNVVTLNKKRYSDLAKLKESYEKTVESKYHPAGTDYNSIITHELGHGLLEYIKKTYKITGPEIRAKVLKKVGIKQKDVKEHLSEYAMAKPREAHEFFAEAFAEYMTSKNPRPLAQAFGEEINRILNS